MPMVTVRVDAKIPPKPGKKRWTLKASDGDVYGAMPTVADKIQTGFTYELGYKNDEFRGTVYKVVEFSKLLADVPAMPPLPAGSPATAARHVDDHTAERIFVCGGLNAILGNPNVQPMGLASTNVIEFVAMLRHSWRMTLGKKPTDMEEAMGDEIPY